MCLNFCSHFEKQYLHVVSLRSNLLNSKTSEAIILKLVNPNKRGDTVKMLLRAIVQVVLPEIRHDKCT